ncbi:MAG TPA: OmpA family protein [Kofleriaceae bacterium]|jgi:OOP family OmpA-OmpF porin|nr:OmpA family protein [Kofleriaceae bacterium]
MRQAFAAVLVAALAVGCHSKAEVQATTTPPPAPAADPAPATEEPETEPVVKEEPKTLDIQKDVIRLKPGIKILFATDSDKLLPESSPILDEVASVMAQNEKIHIRVEGHTDNSGNKDHNQDLSTRRAAAVKSYLAAKGTPGDRLDSVGCGQGTPVADNATEDGRAQNRRVEFVIIRRRHPRGQCELYKPGEHHRRHDKDVAPASAPGR